MSEPNAGSDLASLRTRAELVGDEFVVNGQKVWTSGAHHADWCLCFVRTDPDAPKHKGISALIIDTTSPGVERRPFPELSDMEFCDFNEVFFNDVRVPKEQLVGPLNGGWPITQGSLAHERAMLWITYAYEVQRAVTALVALGDRRDARAAAASATTRASATGSAGFYVDAQALLTMGYRGFSKFLHGKSSPEHSLLKLFGSEALQQALHVRCRGARCRTRSTRRSCGPNMWREGSWEVQYLRSFGATIPGGTSEVQRNIIAERVLGLPRVAGRRQRSARQTPGSPSRAVRMQNSLPSGSASTTHFSSPWPTSARVAPNAEHARDLGVLVVGDEVDVQPVLDGLRLRHGPEHQAGIGVFVLGDDDFVLGLVDDLPLEHRGPEAREGGRVARVDDDGVEA